MQSPDVLDCLLHHWKVAGQRSVEAKFDEVEIDLVLFELHRDEVRLLSNAHGRARMLRSQFDDATERELIDRAVVGSKPLSKPSRPVFEGNRAQQMKSSEAAEGAVAWSKQITHHMFEAAGEQIADARAPLEYRAHTLCDGVGVAVRAPIAGDLLKLIEEQDQSMPVGLRHSVWQGQRQVERPLGVLGCEARSERDLDNLTELALEFEDRRTMCGTERGLAELPGSMNQPPNRRTIGNHGHSECLGKLDGVADPEQVKMNRVTTSPGEATDGGIADARLARSSRGGHDQIRSICKRGRDFCDVLRTSDHLACRDRRICWEKIATGLAHARSLSRALHK